MKKDVARKRKDVARRKRKDDVARKKKDVAEKRRKDVLRKSDVALKQKKIDIVIGGRERHRALIRYIKNLELRNKESNIEKYGI